MAAIESMAAVSAVLAGLHERVVQGDRVAAESFASQMLPVLRRRLTAAFPRADRDDLSDAVEDAILEYLARPARYDLSRGVPLDRFLYLIAWRRLANRLRNTTARARVERDYARTAVFERPQRQSDGATDAKRADLARRLVSVALNPQEREAVRGWLTGKPVSHVALALGVGDRSPREQRGEVKRFKDRIRARLRRQVLG